MKYFSSLKPKSIKTRIIVTSAAFALLLALFVATVSYTLFQRFLRDNQSQSALNNLQLLGNEIDADLNDIVTFANWCGIDTEIRAYLLNMQGAPVSSRSAGERQSALEAYDKLALEFNKVSSSTYMGRSVISTPDGENFIQIQPSPSTSKGNVTRNLMEAPFFDELIDARDVRWIGLVENPVTAFQNPLVIPVLRPITNKYSSDRIGWIYVEVKPEIVTDRLKNFLLPDDSAVYITFQNSRTYRFDGEKLVEDSLPDHGLVSFRLPDQGWTVSQLLSSEEFKLQAQYYLFIILVIFLVIIAMGMGLMYSMNRMITAPVVQIIGRLKRVGAGDFSRDRSIEWDDEMGEIGRGINDLAANVKGLMDKKVQDEKTRQELEYKILQSQINPHFLYNTLNSIKWMATIQGAEGIADMTTALSRLMKNVSKGSDSLIPLHSEKALLDDYFTIMRYRYGGSVELGYEIADDALLNCMVHRFSLQPIVENAIFHGIEPKGGAGSILIRIWDEWLTLSDGKLVQKTATETAAGSAAKTAADITANAADISGAPASARQAHCLLIAVTDNGVGMDQATAARVLSGDDGSVSNDFFKHVGVANVNQRIRFTFGEQYGISIESVPGEYTTMLFTLPYMQ